MLSEDMPRGVSHGCAPDEKSASGSWIIFFLVIFTGLFLAYFHNRYVFTDLKAFKLDLLTQSDNGMLSGELLNREKLVKNGEEGRVVWLKEGFKVPFMMDEPQTVRLRIRSYFPALEYGSKELILAVNGLDAGTLSPKWNGDYSVFNLMVPKKYFREGNNTLSLSVNGAGHYSIGLDYINLRNYAGISKRFPRAIVYYDGNRPEGSVFGKPYDYLFFPAVLFILWIAGGNLNRVSGGAPLGAALKRTFYALVIPAAIFFLSAAYSKVTSYTLSYHEGSFFILALAPSVAFILFHAVVAAYRGGALLLQKGSIDSLKARVMSINIKPSPGRLRLVSTVKFIGRHAATFAIVAFMVCLTVAGVSMIAKRQDVAERMADVAYFSLLFGVLLRIFDLKRED